jgi:glucose-1-phosphate cytidylyltransferase
MEVVILCGGKGTRSYPFTDVFPKAMMPIGGSPIIVHLMKIFSSQGLTRFVLAAGHRQEMLRDYFTGRFSHWKVDVVDTGEDTDTADRIRHCEPYLSDTFMATYADGLGNINFADHLRLHRSHGGLATVTSVPLRSQYGTIHCSESQQVHSFQEKPVIRDYWINAGFFTFEKRCFQHWEGRNLETHVLPHLAKRGVLYTYRHDGFWKSMDTSKDQQEMEAIYRAGEPPWMQPHDPGQLNVVIAPQQCDSRKAALVAGA